MEPTRKEDQDLTVVYRKGEDGYIVAECLEIPGCMSQGKTLEEARENILDAIQGCLVVLLADSIKQARSSPPNLVGIQQQQLFRVTPPEVVQIPT